jgi:hypothetical protein
MHFPLDQKEDELIISLLFKKNSFVCLHSFIFPSFFLCLCAAVIGEDMVGEINQE